MFDIAIKSVQSGNDQITMTTTIFSCEDRIKKSFFEWQRKK